ncbi:hypothetical protein FQZ97_1067650 [compost metagenome]
MDSIGVQSITQGCLARSNTFCKVPTAWASSSASLTQTARLLLAVGVKVLPVMEDTVSGMSYH